MPHFHHVSICNQNQSISNLVIVWQTTKAIALLFGQKCLIFITCQSAIKLNQFQIWSWFGKKYQGYSLTFWPKMPHFHHFSICNQNQSISNLVIVWQNTKAIALLRGQTCLIFITFQSAIKINQFHIWSCFGKIPRLYSLTFWPKMPHCHHFSICNQNQLISNLVNFLAKYQGYSLTFWLKMPHFDHFSICNQNQSMSNVVMFWQNTKAIALLFGQTCLIFITFQSAIKLNQFQIWSCFVKKYQGYSLTFWPNMPHFQHLSICNHNQSISNLVIVWQNTKAIALPFGQKCLIFITCQSAIELNQFQIWSLFGKIPRL